MKIIDAHSPDTALFDAIELATNPNNTVVMQSRNGPVVRFNSPVTTVWHNPLNRILWSALRDCNPFLHFIESAWMLAGRDDLATVKKLAAQMQAYTDDGQTLNGAYGYRWRNHFGFDQIGAAITELNKNRESRRVVLQMWDGYADLQSAVKGSADVPCNTTIYFDPMGSVLNMTVSNRSNDAVWGCYGANLVHMSILHEYVAAQTNFKLGTYYQVSNNLHFYTENEVTKRLMTFENDLVKNNMNLLSSHLEGRRVRDIFRSMNEPLFESISEFSDSQIKADLNGFIDSFNLDRRPDVIPGDPHFYHVLDHLMTGFITYKKSGANAAYEQMKPSLEFSRWIAASMLWLRRRPSFKN